MGFYRDLPLYILIKKKGRKTPLNHTSYKAVYRHQLHPCRAGLFLTAEQSLENRKDQAKKKRLKKSIASIKQNI